MHASSRAKTHATELVGEPPRRFVEVHLGGLNTAHVGRGQQRPWEWPPDDASLKYCEGCIRFYISESIQRISGRWWKLVRV